MITVAELRYIKHSSHVTTCAAARGGGFMNRPDGSEAHSGVRELPRGIALLHLTREPRSANRSERFRAARPAAGARAVARGAGKACGDKPAPPAGRSREICRAERPARPERDAGGRIFVPRRSCIFPGVGLGASGLTDCKPDAEHHRRDVHARSAQACAARLGSRAGQPISGADAYPRGLGHIGTEVAQVAYNRGLAVDRAPDDSRMYEPNYCSLAWP
jgi:hypothetical protein